MLVRVPTGQSKDVLRVLQMSFEGVSRVLQGRFQYFASDTLLQSILFLFVSGRSEFFNNIIEISFKYA